MSWLEGAEVAAISLTEPVSWWFEFSDGTALRAECLWRVITDEHVEVTSADHGHQFGLTRPVDAGVLAMRAFTHAQVRRASLADATGDMTLEFNNGARLEILTTSMAYEGWAITSPGGDEIIGLGGGRIEVLPRT